MRFVSWQGIKSAVDKLVDEYLKGVVTYKYPFAGSGHVQALQKVASATTICIK